MTRFQWKGKPAPYALWREWPLVTVTAQAGAFRIRAVNALAQSAGVDPGLSLPDARAVVPTLKVIEEDLESDRACLTNLVACCRRYTPWVAVEAPAQRSSGLWLDVTGCTHLFGGEQGLLDDLSMRFNHLGLDVRLGLADTPGAAWAAAHYIARENNPALVPEEQHSSHLSDLPVSALRLSTSALETLTRLGVCTITDLLSLPRAPLTRRFGHEVCLRLDQLTGRVDEPLSPEIERLPYVARMVFPEPIGRTEDVEAAVQALLGSLCARLEVERNGARRLTCEIFRVDSTVERLNVGTSQAVRDPNHLFRLFREKIRGLDAGLGIEFLLLTVTSTNPLQIEQGTLTQKQKSPNEVPSTSGQELSLLIDRLEGRLGEGGVVSPRLCESHIPERAARWMPALCKKQVQVADGSPLCSGHVHLRPGTRPIFLLPKPESISPLLLDSDALKERPVPLKGFVWRRSEHRVAVAEGPERISGRWWQNALPDDRSIQCVSYFELCKDGGAVRDYWRVESNQGLRFWLFYLPFQFAASESNQEMRWFMHGLFP